ncbi:MAG: GAF domain-containing SpoIIE family protein phosphatase [Actinomycetota bacterium]
MTSNDTETSQEEQRIQELERTLASLREDSEVAYVLLGLSGGLAEVRSIEQTLELVVRTIPELFGAARCLAAHLDGEGQHFEILADWGYDEESRSSLQAYVEANDPGFPFLAQALKEGAPIMASAADSPSGGAVIAIPLVRWGQNFGGLRLEFEGDRSFGARDLALARGIARQVGVALNNARRFSLLKSLREFGFRSSARLRLKDVIAETVEGVNGLLDADGAWLYFLDASRGSLVSTGANPGRLALPESLARLDLSVAPWARLRMGEMVIAGDLSRFFPGDQNLVGALAPLRTATDPLVGALLVVFEHGKSPDAEELEALSVLAGQAGQSLENARRFDRERSVAKSLQAALLRTEMPEMRGCSLGALYEAADALADVGGDFYDVIDLPGDSFGVVVGDVSGKGAEAAAQTAMVKYMLRAFATRNSSPSSVLFHLNNALVKDMQEDRFITLLYARFDAVERTCSIAAGGHPAPLIYRSASDEVEVGISKGTIVGAFDDCSYDEQTISIGDGDVFMAYTDGLIEARDSEGELYEEDRIKESLRRNARSGTTADELVRRVYEDARSFGTVTDDTVVLALSCGP